MVPGVGGEPPVRATQIATWVVDDVRSMAFCHVKPRPAIVGSSPAPVPNEDSMDRTSSLFAPGATDAVV